SEISFDTARAPASRAALQRTPGAQTPLPSELSDQRQRSKMTYKLLRSSAAALIASGSLAPVALAQAATELPPIEAREGSAEAGATGERGSGFSVPRADIETGLASTADPLMLISRQPGVEVQSNGGIASLPILRGLADDRVGVLIDGQAITGYCPNHMNSATSYINAARVERIVVTPTLSPVSLGGDNIAGIISVESRAPEFSAGGIEYSGEVATMKSARPCSKATNTPCSSPLSLRRMCCSGCAWAGRVFPMKASPTSAWI
ncbi:MAG: hypothetical protein B7Z22_15270, partial [Hyphomonas sp. 32-62-5]